MLNAGELDITIPQGSDFNIPFQVLDVNNDAVSINGATIRGQIRKKVESADIIATFTGSIVDGPNGEGLLSLTAAQTAAIPADNSGQCNRKQTCYAWDAEIVFNDGVVMRILQGQAYLDPEVTR